MLQSGPDDGVAAKKPKLSAAEQLLEETKRRALERAQALRGAGALPLAPASMAAAAVPAPAAPVVPNLQNLQASVQARLAALRSQQQAGITSGMVQGAVQATGAFLLLACFLAGLLASSVPAIFVLVWFVFFSFSFFIYVY